MPISIFTNLFAANLAGKFANRNYRIRTVVDLVITVCEFMGPIAASIVGVTLLGIALDKIRV